MFRSVRSIALAGAMLLGIASLIHAQTAPAAVGPNEDTVVSVVRIRMIISGLRYDWTDRAAMPERAADGVTMPATVASFLDFAPGDGMTGFDLERRRSAAEDRLNACGYFYSAEVLTVPATSRPDGRVVLVRVTEGFPWRFGGGPLFGFVGQENAFGGRKSWRAAVGYNLDGFLWEDGAVGGGPFSYRAGAIYSNNLGTGFLDSHLIESDLSAGIRLHPDFSLFIDSPMRYRQLIADASNALASFPDTRTGFEWVPCVGFTWSAGMRLGTLRLSATSENSGGVSIRSDGGSHAVIRGRESISCAFLIPALGGGQIQGPGAALQLSYGTARPVRGSLPAYSLFDIYGSAGGSVRSGYPFLDLQAAGFGMVNAEISLPLPPFQLGPVVSITLEPFLFTDAAAVERTGGSLAEFEAFGIGARLVFANPIFACFSFSYGWNPLGAGRFVFSTARSF